MKARCYKCGLTWNISLLHKMDKQGYECPVCEWKRKQGARKQQAKSEILRRCAPQNDTGCAQNDRKERKARAEHEEPKALKTDVSKVSEAVKVRK